MTTTTITIAPDVAAAVGDEQAGQITRGETLTAGQCWICAEQVDTTTQETSLLCLIPEAAGGALKFAHLAHAACSPSRIITVTDDELAARRGDGQEPDGTTDITVVTILLAQATGEPRPIALVHVHETLWVADAPGDDKNDGLAQRWLSKGWQLVSRWNQTLTIAPDWHLEWQPLTANPDGLAHLQLTAPGAEIITDIGMYPAPGWPAAVQRAGTVDMYHVPLPIHTWTEDTDYTGLMQAVKAGRVIGAAVPVEVIDTP